ncbi:hypothetical protein AOA12_16550 [Microbacterium sp. No. 7]|nr:hypothetical protein AOA12_16550 [Microbacterium sp. No. 7]
MTRRYTREEVAAYRVEKMEEITRRLQESVQRLVTGQDWLESIRFAARFRSRSWLNTLLLFSQHADAYQAGRVPSPYPTYVAGRVAWKALGRWPTQPGFVIRQPVLAAMASATPQDPGSWRRLPRGQRPEPGEVVQQRMVGVKPAKVWDVSMTGGTPIPERPEPQLLEGAAPPGLLVAVQGQIRAGGYTLQDAVDAGVLGGANGITDFTTRTVTVRVDMDEAARLKTTLHELAHVKLHAPDSLTARGEHRGIDEVEAESVAMFVAASHGLDTSGYTVPYVAGWADSVNGRTVTEVLQDTAEKARRTALGILENLPETAASDGYPPGMSEALRAQANTPSLHREPARAGHPPLER